MKSHIEKYFSNLKDCLDKLNKDDILKLAEIISNTEGKNTVYVLGNGGSASIASHFVCDFVKDVACAYGRRFKVISLSDNVSTVTAYANDMDFDLIFVEQLKNFLHKDDVVIAISGSGNSKNILNAVEYANKNGAITCAMTGFDGGELAQIAKYNILSPSSDIQIVQDTHTAIMHLLMQLVKEK